MDIRMLLVLVLLPCTMYHDGVIISIYRTAIAPSSEENPHHSLHRALISEYSGLALHGPGYYVELVPMTCSCNYKSA